MDAILHVGIAQFVFAAILSFTKKPRQLADDILGYWLLLMVSFMVMALLKMELKASFDEQIQLFPFVFTFGPFLFLYVNSLVNEIPRFRKRNWLHFAPFLISAIIALALDTNDTVDEAFLNGKSFDLNRIVYSLTMIISVVGYIFVVLGKLAVHRYNLLNHFSYESNRISLRWLYLIVVNFIVTFLATIVAIIINAVMETQVINPGILLFLGFSIFAFFISFYGIRQPAIFAETHQGDARFVDEISEELKEEQEQEKEIKAIKEVEESQKYEKSSLTEETAKEYAKKLIEHMEKDKPYLQRDLTIQAIANNLEIPRHHLTQVINEKLNKNFYTLVNEYRIEEVKKRLIDSQYSHFTLLTIAHDAGFNSKSSFNMIFKKHVNMTPSQYKKNYFKKNPKG